MRPNRREGPEPVQLEVDPEAPATVVTDSDKLRQIIKNFLGNAVRSSPTTAASVWLSPAPQTMRRRVQARDRGYRRRHRRPGGQAQVIFEAFERADGSTEPPITAAASASPSAGGSRTCWQHAERGGQGLPLLCLCLPWSPSKADWTWRPTRRAWRGRPNRMIALPSASLAVAKGTARGRRHA